MQGAFLTLAGSFSSSCGGPRPNLTQYKEILQQNILLTFYREKRCRFDKKGADLTTFGQEKKGADLTKKGEDLTNSPISKVYFGKI